jgi:exonuclease III
MKLISWNMAGASPRISKSRFEDSWKYLLEKNPDIALVQEARIPQWVSEKYNVVWEKAYDNKSWGSGILSKYPIMKTFDVPALEPQLESLLRQFRGQAVGAVVDLPGWGETVVVSVHSPARTIPLSEFHPEILPVIKLKLNPKVWRADVIYGALRKLPDVARNYIFGGDFNTSRLFDERYWPRGNQEYFDRMESAGFVECLRKYYETEPRTWFRDGDGPYQLDYIFCDPAQNELLQNCCVDEKPAINGLSDHAMIIAEFSDRA